MVQLLLVSVCAGESEVPFGRGFYDEWTMKTDETVNGRAVRPRHHSPSFEEGARRAG